MEENQQMSVKSIRIIALAAAICILVTVWLGASPIWATAAAVQTYKIGESAFANQIEPQLLDKTSGQYNYSVTHLVEDAVSTGNSSDYQELLVCLDMHKLTPLPFTKKSPSVKDIPTQYSDRVISVMPYSVSGYVTKKGQVSISILLYTAGMSDSDIKAMTDSLTVRVKWELLPGITGAADHKLG